MANMEKTYRELTLLDIADRTGIAIRRLKYVDDQPLSEIGVLRTRPGIQGAARTFYCASAFVLSLQTVFLGQCQNRPAAKAAWDIVFNHIAPDSNPDPLWRLHKLWEAANAMLVGFADESYVSVSLIPELNRGLMLLTPPTPLTWQPLRPQSGTSKRAQFITKTTVNLHELRERLTF